MLYIDRNGKHIDRNGKHFILALMLSYLNSF